MKTTTKLTLNIGYYGWSRKKIFHFISLKTALNSNFKQLKQKKSWLSVTKEDRLSHQVSTKVPNFNAKE